MDGKESGDAIFKRKNIKIEKGDVMLPQVSDI